MADGAATPIDRDWLRAHPLPRHDDGTDKNSRGHVVAIGGSRGVPGGLGLTGRAALGAGAGKIQLATVASCAIGLGVSLPEAGVIALGETGAGEIDAADIAALKDNLERCDSVVVGPAMGDRQAAGALLDELFGRLLEKQTVLLDAIALHALRGREACVRAYEGECIVTPNPDEMTSLLSCDEARITADPAGCAREVADRLSAVTVCKGGESFVAAPGGTLLHYKGGGVGLATGGSGDVLAGLIAGLVARGAEPVVAAAWGVWLHGEAGRCLADTQGPLGFLASELAALVPRLMGDLS